MQPSAAFPRNAKIIPAETLRGPWYQKAGGIWYVDSKDQFIELAKRLDDTEESGLDTETQGCNPKKESAVGRARIMVASVSWLDPGLGIHPHTRRPLANRVLIPNFGKAEAEGWFYYLQPWLQSPKHKKVGHNIFSFDRHAFANMGIELMGISMDTLRASRDEDVTRKEHDLKAWLGSEPFCYDLWGGFTEVFRIPKPLTYGKCLNYVESVAGELLWGGPKACTKRQRVDQNECKGCGGELQPEYSDTQTILAPWDLILSDPKWFAVLADYATLDSKGTLELKPHLVELLSQQSWKRKDGTTMLDFYNQKRNPYMYLLTEMERFGQKIDPLWCEDMADKATRDMERLERELVQWVGADMNFGSWQQLQHLLYGTGCVRPVQSMRYPIEGRGFPIPPMAKKDYATGESEMPTDSDAIQWLIDHVQSKHDKAALKLLLEWTKAKRTRTNYLEKLPKCMDSAGRIHCQIAPDTETGRLAASNPPVQQIPNAEKGDPYEVREAFTVDSGNVLIVGDWSQLEPRIMAHFLIVLFDDYMLADDLKTGDVYLAAALRTWPWEFPEGATVPDVKKVLKAENNEILDKEGKPLWKRYKSIRKDAKILVLSTNYGKTEFGLGNDLRDEHGNPIGTAAAKVKLDAYFAAYMGIKRFQKWAATFAWRTGAARTLGGRYRKIPQLRWESKAAQKHGARQAGNTPVQGGAADIALEAQLKLNTYPLPELIEMGYFNEELYDLGFKHNMQVHDELHFEGPYKHRERAREIVQNVMENPLDEPLKVILPAEVKFAMTWREAK